MNRLFMASVVGAVLVYLGLYFYDSTNDTRLYTVITGGFALGFIVGVTHMLIDRRLTIWTPTAIAIIYVMGAMAALFALIFWPRYFDPLSPGIRQGWVDLIVALGAIGLPVWFLSIARYRLDRWKGRPATRPSDEFDYSRTVEMDRRTHYRRSEDRELRGID
jgi:peptidoglycan/LPS O-acetylase OafA/YrhL